MAIDVDALIFDLDNTLIECLGYYVEARREIHRRLLDHGVTADWEEFTGIYRTLGRSYFKAYGYSPERVPATLQETARSLFERQGGEAPAGVLREVYAIASAIFDAPYEPYEGALQTLDWARNYGYRVAVCTKGDAEVQERKLRLHGVRERADHVSIVPKKGAPELRAAAEALGVAPERTAVVGDSLHDDVEGGRAAGMVTIWVSDDPIHLPEIDGALPSTEADHVIGRVSELPRLLTGMPALAPAL